jgi:peptidoglycan/LPS O-acetylase OafA/YrhL
LGVALATWGAVTRVRRRLAFGAGAVLLSSLLLIGVPIARAVPNLSGPGLWLTVAGIGAVAIVVATMMEQGRERVRQWRTLLDEMTREWERLEDADPAPHDTDVVSHA